MAKKDYYAALGLSKGASDDEIKKAHRTLVKKYHPDLNPNDPQAAEKFKEVQEAYDVLIDPEKRAMYDKYGTVDPNEMPFGAGGGSGFGGFDFSSSFGGFEDILSGIFGGGRSRSNSNGPRRGEDIQKRMNVSLEDVIFGKKTTISVPLYEKCPDCSGKGAKSDSDIVTCSTCHGTGTIIEEVQSFFGRSQTRRPCHECNGTGKVIKNKCSTCHGEGKIKVNKTVEVSIPIGIQTGQQIRLSGFGSKGYNGGENGDLYIQFYVKEDPKYVRDGDSLRATINVSFAEAALGCKKEVDTPYGKDTIDIPEGTQTDTVLRLKGKGIPNLRSGVKGDLFYKLVIETPKNLTKEQKELLLKFDQSNTKGSIFKKMKLW